MNNVVPPLILLSLLHAASTLLTLLCPFTAPLSFHFSHLSLFFDSGLDVLRLSVTYINTLFVALIATSTPTRILREIRHNKFSLQKKVTSTILRLCRALTTILQVSNQPCSIITSSPCQSLHRHHDCIRYKC